MADDRELWERIRSRDEGAFEAFYRGNAARLCGCLRRLLASSQTAEDLTQEIFAQMWRSPNGFQPERGSLRSYLFGIGRKQASEWWRKQQRDQRVADEKRDCEVAPSASTASTVGDVLARLPEEQRSLLWLREVEGQSYAELATILDVPVGTVKSRLFAAREELRRIWRGDLQQKRESR